MSDNEGFPVMRGERQIRFVCGAVAGSFAGCQLGSVLGSKAGEGLLTVVTAIAFGLAAAYRGDDFWRAIRWW